MTIYYILMILLVFFGVLSIYFVWKPKNKNHKFTNKKITKIVSNKSNNTIRNLSNIKKQPKKEKIDEIIEFDFLKSLEVVINSDRVSLQEKYKNELADDSMSIEDKLNMYFSSLREADASVQMGSTDYQDALELYLVPLIKQKKFNSSKSLDHEIRSTYEFCKKMSFYNYYEEFYSNLSKSELEKMRIEEEKQLIENLQKQKDSGMLN